MAKKVYALRILVETGEDIEIVESTMRVWGKATFHGFVLLELVPTQTSLVDIDTLSHTLSSMVKSQERMQKALRETIDIFTKISGLVQQLIAALLHKKKPDEATTEET